MEPAGDTARVSAEVVDLRGLDTEITVVRDRPIFSLGAAIALWAFPVVAITKFAEWKWVVCLVMPDDDLFGE